MTTRTLLLACILAALLGWAQGASVTRPDGCENTHDPVMCEVNR